MKSVPTVIFVDDDTRIHSAWRRSLSQEPYHMLFAKSGQEAIQVLQGIRVSVVVTDYAMPNGDGLFLLGYLRERMPHIKTILVSGHATLSVAQHAVNELGVSKLFQKPCNPVALGIAIREQIAAIQDQEGSTSSLSSMMALERAYPGISKVERDEEGAILLGGPKGPPSF